MYQSKKLLAAIALAVCLAPFCGCGGESQGPKLVSATGVVSLNGSPLSGAVVTLHPVGTTRGSGASARTDTAGKFELSSPPRGKGAVPGEYKVVISKLVLPDGTDFPENSPVSPMDSNAKEQLPPEYSDLEQTTLTVNVPEAGGELAEFKLVGQ